MTSARSSGRIAAAVPLGQQSVDRGQGGATGVYGIDSRSYSLHGSSFQFRFRPRGVSGTAGMLSFGGLPTSGKPSEQLQSAAAAANAARAADDVFEPVKPVSVAKVAIEPVDLLRDDRMQAFLAHGQR